MKIRRSNRLLYTAVLGLVFTLSFDATAQDEQVAKVTTETPSSTPLTSAAVRSFAFC